MSDLASPFNYGQQMVDPFLPHVSSLLTSMSAALPQIPTPFQQQQVPGPSQQQVPGPSQQQVPGPSQQQNPGPSKLESFQVPLLEAKAEPELRKKDLLRKDCPRSSEKDFLR